jgi:hypothetical protein
MRIEDGLQKVSSAGSSPSGPVKVKRPPPAVKVSAQNGRLLGQLAVGAGICLGGQAESVGARFGRAAASVDGWDLRRPLRGSVAARLGTSPAATGLGLFARGRMRP